MWLFYLFFCLKKICNFIIFNTLIINQYLVYNTKMFLLYSYKYDK